MLSESGPQSIAPRNALIYARCRVRPADFIPSAVKSQLHSDLPKVPNSFAAYNQSDRSDRWHPQTTYLSVFEVPTVATDPGMKIAANLRPWAK